MKFKLTPIVHWRLKIYTLLGVIFLLLCLTLYFAYDPNSELYGPVFDHVNTTKKIVALTFDDGPNGQATIDTLKILKEKNVKATFFLVGENVLYYPDIARETVEDGNEVGNHTLHHRHALPFRGTANIIKDLQLTNDIISNATGVTPKFFRPPFGFRTPRILNAAAKQGMVVVTWNDLTTDYRLGTPESLTKRIVSSVHPGGIIVLHDGFATVHAADRTRMLQALPNIIDQIKAQGYTFVTLSELIQQQ